MALDQFEDRLLLLSHVGGVADGDGAAHAHLAVHHFFKQSRLQTGQRQTVRGGGFAERDSLFLEVLDADAGIAKELRRVDRGAAAFGDVL